MMVYVLTFESIDSRFGASVLGVYGSQLKALLEVRAWMEEGEQILSEQEGNVYYTIETTDGTYVISERIVES